jgi:rod shape-determining protein MreD
LIGFGNGLFRKIFYDDDSKLPLTLIVSSDFIYGNLVCIFLFIMRSKFHYFYYLKTVILPEVIYTALVTLVLYQIILFINKKLEAEEKRSASKFV